MTSHAHDDEAGAGAGGSEENSAGDAESLSASRLLIVCAQRLDALAAHALRGLSGRLSLDHATLLQDAFESVSRRASKWRSREQFLAAMSAAMDGLVMEARTRGLSAIVERVRAIDPVGAELLRLRFGEGASMPECAEALGLSLRATERLWQLVRSVVREMWDDNERDDGQASGVLVP